MKPANSSIIIRPILRLAIVSVLLLGLSACDPDIYDDNDNSKLFGTEWVSEHGTFAMTFEEPDWAGFYMDGDLLGSGLYEYNAKEGVITFDVFNVIDDSHEIFEGRWVKIVITDAEVSKKEMTIYFHELADDEEYYIELFKK
ncbi:MAG: hypothetical protein IKN31_04315 [Bacteroidales bacterium]|nr:hypothetical protein [Bacteroidales bacterium]